MTLPFDFSTPRVSEMLTSSHVPFLAPTARIYLVISDLCLTLNFMQLYDLDPLRVVDLNFTM